VKQLRVFSIVLLFAGGMFSAYAQDSIILRDGNVIEAKVTEITSSEIRYKRFDHQTGPTIVVPVSSVLSIKYENGRVEIFNAAPGGAQTGNAVSSGAPQSSLPVSLQNILNTLPAIPIAGNTMKFEFAGDTWTAKVNGENFSMGTITVEGTDGGCILTLKQTHIWPGAVGRTAGRVASMVPGGAAVGGALNTAGSIASAAGAVEASGTAFVLDYKAGPPAKLSLVRTEKTETETPDGGQTTGEHPLVAGNRFDLDDFGVFAISVSGMPTLSWALGVGVAITVFEKYEPGAFFTPSYFLAGKVMDTYYSNSDVNTYTHAWTVGAGVLFKHRFRGNRVLWNFGPSLEIMWASVSSRYGSGFSYSGDSTLCGIGIQTGFSFRFNPYNSFDINGLLKFPFGTVKNMKPDNYYYYGGYGVNSSPSKSHWPFIGGVELAITTMFPYRIRKR
jgi:hypothetical protein